MAVRPRLAALRARFRPPRRLRPRLGGTVLVAGVFLLGLATLNTGNNLLYLLVGQLLGLIALSGWLSEQSIAGLAVERRVPPSVTAGQRARIEYRIRNRKRRLATVSLELSEAHVRRVGDAPAAARDSAAVVPVGAAFLPALAAGESAAVHGWLEPPRRGVYRLERLTLSTRYPFGLFVKERDLVVPGALVVWPRTDRPVRAVQTGGARGDRRRVGAGAAAGAERAEFRGLRPYRSGDDPRDVHWRSSARLSVPVVREYDREAADSWWLVLDLGGTSSVDLQESAVELAAALAARAAARGDRFGFAAGHARLVPAATGGQLEAVLDVLAAVRFHPGATLALPAPPGECVLVTAAGAAGADYADVVTAGAEAG